MPTPVTVFRWDDVGAPQLNTGKPSEIINVLKKCLVEGYGSKLPLDWSIVFEDNVTQKIVFQNKVAAAGSGGMVRFRSNTATDANYTVMRFVAAKSFADIDNPFQPGFEQAFRQEIAQQKGWVIIGTPKAFYFMICRVPALTTSGSKMGSAGHYNSNIFIGDFESFIPADCGRFISTNNTESNNADVSLFSTLDCDSFRSQAVLIMRADGGAFSMPHRLFAPFGGAQVSASAELLPKVLAPICIFVGGSSSNVGSSISDTNGGTVNGSLLFPWSRGRLPGMYQGDFVGYQNTNWPVTKTIDGKQMLLVKNHWSYGCSMWIDQESWE